MNNNEQLIERLKRVANIEPGCFLGERCSMHEIAQDAIAALSPVQDEQVRAFFSGEHDNLSVSELRELWSRDPVEFQEGEFVVWLKSNGQTAVKLCKEDLHDPSFYRKQSTKEAGATELINAAEASLGINCAVDDTLGPALDKWKGDRNES